MNTYLETENLILRQYTESDVDALTSLNNDPDILHWIPYLQRERDKIKEDILRYFSYYKKYVGYGAWATIEKSSSAFIGWYMFLPFGELPYFNPEFGDAEDIELGFYFTKATWGKGYATEGSKAIISNGFSKLGTQRVMGTALSRNKASIRVMEKVGMQLERKFIYQELESWGIPAQEVVIYGLNKNTYQKSL